MYSYITSQMVWSYSRISTFDDCPYQFFLKYIELVDEAPMFFSEYGSFIHRLLEAFFSGKQGVQEIISHYILHFREEVRTDAPNPKVFSSYFLQGLDYLRSLQPPSGRILGVELGLNFTVHGFPFQGFVDLLAESGGKLVLVDHKSHQLKPRSKHIKPTKSDTELDRYLRQLYLYAIAIHENHGRYPDFLCFNSYRTGTRIIEPFSESVCGEVAEWACSCVGRIVSTQEWNPNVDYFRCRYLCSVSHECEYYQAWGRRHN